MKSYQVRRAGTSSLTLRVSMELTLTRSVSEVCARPEQQNFRCLGRKKPYATSAIAIYPIEPSSRGNGDALLGRVRQFLSGNTSSFQRYGGSVAQQPISGPRFGL